MTLLKLFFYIKLLTYFGINFVILPSFQLSYMFRHNFYIISIKTFFRQTIVYRRRFLYHYLAYNYTSVIGFIKQSPPAEIDPHQPTLSPLSSILESLAEKERLRS